MLKAQLQLKLRNSTVRMFALQQQIAGTRQLYEAACIANDNTKADEYRAAVHDLIDVQLDVTAEQMLLSKAIMETPD